MKVFGYLRFSYAGRSDSFLSRAGLSREEYHQRLYDERRMLARFALFERLCIPSLKAQTDQDFRFFVLVSPHMPLLWRARLDLAIADMPQIRVLVSTADHVKEPFNAALRDEMNVDREWGVHFRLDDDDALGIHMVAALRRYAKRAWGHCVLSAPKGLYVGDATGTFEIWPQYRANIAMGYALVNPPGVVKNPYDLAHHAYASKHDCLLIPDIAGYIHTAHAHSDTRFGQRYEREAIIRNFMSHNPKARGKHIEQMLSDDFPWTSEAQLRQLFSERANL